jgi:ribonucleoside-diphosphate reductase subunit M1
MDSVAKRDGSIEAFSFDKILNRVLRLGDDGSGHILAINYTSLVQKIIDRLYDGIPTTQIDELTAQQCASLITTHPDYGILASRLLISNHHKNTNELYIDVIKELYKFKDVHSINSPLVSEELYTIVIDNANEIQDMIDYDRDYHLDYFGFKTLERAYLQRIGNRIVERPQHMWMRVAIAVHGNNMENIKLSYDLMSNKFFTHATPTLFNAGTPRQQLSSCYLLAMEDDSIEGIYSTLTDCAKISKWAGGIGLHIHNVRASGSHIRGTNGVSNGIVPMLKAFNSTARYVDQGGGKRNGSFAIYLEPWHSDIKSFLDMKKNHGDEEQRARDLFYALWIPDLFMHRVKNGMKWTLMCPDKCPGLSDVYGEDFVSLYEKYESEGRGVTIEARDIWFKILDSQIETGTPYMLYKDACNNKSNQKNIGVIKSSNLCTEIVEYSDPTETAVCNLASIGLPNFVVPTIKDCDTVTVYSKPNCIYCKMAMILLDKSVRGTISENIISSEEESNEYKREIKNEFGETVLSWPQIIIDGKYIGGYTELSNVLRPTFDYKKLHDVVKVVTRNLNQIIDINFYPTDKTEKSNSKHRPIGLGVQGLADTFMLMDLPFVSDKSSEINRNIFETIYHAAVETSIELSIEDTPYSTFNGSPASEGLLSFDLWDNPTFSGMYDWEATKNGVKCLGMRNSLLVAPMPTASTSQILGNNECFEPYTSNIYLRRTIAGEYIVVNKHLLRELVELGLWTEELKNSIIGNNGSVQDIPNIPKCLKEKYKIVWEIPMKDIITMAAERAPFIDQSMSMNLWMKDPTYDKLTAMHFYSFSRGLKTGLYYLRTKAKAAAQQFTIDPTTVTEDDEGCTMCSA